MSRLPLPMSRFEFWLCVPLVALGYFAGLAISPILMGVWIAYRHTMEAFAMALPEARSDGEAAP